MQEEVIRVKPIRCGLCKSTQIRTTKVYRVCNRCGHKEQLE